jgi:hypothetical protein
MEIVQTSAEPAAPCAQPTAAMSLCLFCEDGVARGVAADRLVAAALFASQHTEGTVPVDQGGEVAIEQESVDSPSASLAGANVTVPVQPVHPIPSLHSPARCRPLQHPLRAASACAR